MGKTNEKRLRQLERAALPAPFREVSFGWRSEEAMVELYRLSRAALAGDSEAERMLDAALEGKVTLLPTIAAITNGTN